MTIGDRNFLQAELIALEKLISRMPEANVIDRMSLEARKNEVEAALSALRYPYYEPVRARLTFRGKPTVKSQGIYTEFAANALEKFAGMVAAVGASQTTQLGTRGLIPNREEYQLMITGTATGSFGFELEEAPRRTDIISSDFSPVKKAIDQIMAIMESSMRSDDDLADAIADLDPRAIDAIRAFLGAVADDEAVCAIESSGVPFQFADVEQVNRTKDRLSTENIHEGDRVILGKFQGVLPTLRTFEFFIEENNEIIRGKVGPEIEDASQINRIIEMPMNIRVHTKQVGTGRPRYTLNSYSEAK